jgi:hypothetical protein
MDCPDVTMMFVEHNALRRDLDRMQAAAAQADDPAARMALRAARWVRWLLPLAVRWCLLAVRGPVFGKRILWTRSLLTPTA